jgi:hypothetical protein
VSFKRVGNVGEIVRRWRKWKTYVLVAQCEWDKVEGEGMIDSSKNGKIGNSRLFLDWKKMCN